MNAIHTETTEHKGHSITVEWFYDEDNEPPWEEHDGHGPVSEWTTRDKRPGERVLCSDRSSRRYYDYAEAIKLTKKDGWSGADLSDRGPYATPEDSQLSSELGLSVTTLRHQRSEQDGTAGQRAVRAVEWDFNFLKRWCDNDWYWVGYVVKIEGTDYDESLWGIDSDSIAEYTKTAIDEAKQWLDRELAESDRAACSDIITV